MKKKCTDNTYTCMHVCNKKKLQKKSASFDEFAIDGSHKGSWLQVYSGVNGLM